MPKQANWGELCRLLQGLAPIEKKGQYGFIDNYGQIVITLSYDFAAPFSEGLANVAKQGKWGYIDKQGKIVIPIVYDDARWFPEMKDNKAVEVKKQGEVIKVSGGYESLNH